MYLNLYNRQNDNELARAACGGNEAAFAELFARHRRMVTGLVRRYFQRHDEIEELVQISFSEAWFALGGFRGRDQRSFIAWLAQITVNSCYDELRRRRRSREEVLSQIGETGAPVLEHSAAENRLEHSVIARDLADKLLMALEPADRLVFVLLKANQLSVAEIARLVGWSEAKVKMRVLRSRSIMRRRSRRLA
jgi:RNA polymerase sigma-70 factor, ECF subfamily